MSNKKPLPPSAEVVRLVAGELDPKSVAISSCVSKAWNSIMSSRDLWRDLCEIHYPSLAAASAPPVPRDRRRRIPPVSVTHRRLCELGFSAALRRHRQVVPKTRISLDDLIFSIQIKRSEDNNTIITLWKPCKDLNPLDGEFRFDIETNRVNLNWDEVLLVTWNVFLEGWRGMFTMMDSTDYAHDSSDRMRNKLLPHSCTVRCSSSASITASLQLVTSTTINGEIEVEKLTVAMKNISTLPSHITFVTVDQGLRFLQHFLLPGL